MKSAMKSVTSESSQEGHVTRSTLISFTVYSGLFIAWLAMQLHK